MPSTETHLCTDGQIRRVEPLYERSTNSDTGKRMFKRAGWRCLHCEDSLKDERSLWEKMLPQDPLKGPPLPSGWNIYWPGMKPNDEKDVLPQPVEDATGLQNGLEDATGPQNGLEDAVGPGPDVAVIPEEFKEKK